MTDADELIDYEEDEVLQTPAKTVKDVTKEAAASKDAKKGAYVGMHSAGFRDFLLKPELLRAIVDCGFEHPSEGIFINPILLVQEKAFTCDDHVDDSLSHTRKPDL
jgi:hypothetical protein